MTALRPPKPPAMTMQLSNEVQRALKVHSGNIGTSPGKVAEEILRKALAPVIAKLHELPLHLEVEILDSVQSPSDNSETSDGKTPECELFDELAGRIDTFGRDAFALEIAKERDFARIAEFGQRPGVSREDLAAEAQKSIGQDTLNTAKADVQNWFGFGEIPLDQEDLVRSLLREDEDPQGDSRQGHHAGNVDFDPFDQPGLASQS